MGVGTQSWNPVCNQAIIMCAPIFQIFDHVAPNLFEEIWKTYLHCQSIATQGARASEAMVLGIAPNIFQSRHEEYDIFVFNSVCPSKATQLVYRYDTIS